ncbi:Response regulator mcs4 like protein [Verticillium longisporum]|uniref:Response regulator mcs4 like protein n=1 Tax=Verticillium longisporum TaxID=100787 RepID=A0A8I2ZJD0_VERLO|nr:Response regulator mcs4 like protein [Verticillium longisporum]
MGSDLKARLKAKFSRRSSTSGSVKSGHSHSHGETQLSQRDESRSLASTDNHSRPASVRLDPQSSSNLGAPAPAPAPDADEVPVRIVISPEDSTATSSSTASTLPSEEVQPQESVTRDPSSQLSAAPKRRAASDGPGNDLHHPMAATTSSLASINENQTLVDASIAASPPATKLPPSVSTSARNTAASSAAAAAAASAAVAVTAAAADPDNDDDDDDHLDPLHRGPAASDVLTPAPATAPAPVPATLSASSIARPTGPPRRQSLLPNRPDALIKTLLQAANINEADLTADHLLSINANMVTRKIWVKRAGASATLITINEDDLVDDVRDMILKKYTNSLGRHFDAPDLTLRIFPREERQERLLGPEEPMGRTIDAYFPGGQTVDEALVIDIPTRRTPRPSPRGAVSHPTAVYYAHDTGRPSEAGEGYFPPVGAIPSPNLEVPGAAPNGGPPPPHAIHIQHTGHLPHSISILGTGQVPPIPSPGRSHAYKTRPNRPQLGRTHTSSPTFINGVPSNVGGPPTAHPVHSSFHPRLPPSRTQSNASAESAAIVPPAPPLATPPAPEIPSAIQRISTPPPRIASPRPSSARPARKKIAPAHPVLPAGMLAGGVPPINVLIVEDNPINLKLLEAFVKRLKVRWKTAMNGRDAVKKWKGGGFHLVLMDIQLPIMNGLDATKEIRRLERVNSIGVFSSSASGVFSGSVTSEPEGTEGDIEDKDRLANIELFKSPVIIVALTASSLQSDRHEALAAGCNDFLTKPVNFVWLERKVMEWGCMQALIDFDGWRQWKDFAQDAEENDAAKKAAGVKAKSKKNRLSVTTAAA